MSNPKAQRLLQSAIAQQRAGADAQAVALYKQALAQDRKFWPALLGWSEIEIKRGEIAAAVGLLERASQLKTNEPIIWVNLGEGLRSLGRYKEARAALRRALSLQPLLAEAHCNMGLTLEALHDLAGALESLTRAVEISPRLIDAQLRLCALLLDCGRHEQALHAAERALRHHPEHPGMYNLLGGALRNLARHDDALAAYRRALALDPTLSAVRSNLVYLLSYQPGLDAAEILHEARAWDEQHGKPSGEAVTHANERDPERRLRIGYVSPDFRHHCQLMFMLPLLRRHSREGFEIRSTSWST